MVNLQQSNQENSVNCGFGSRFSARQRDPDGASISAENCKHDLRYPTIKNTVQSKPQSSSPECCHPSMLTPLHVVTPPCCHPYMLSSLHAATPLCCQPSMLSPLSVAMIRMVQGLVASKFSENDFARCIYARVHGHTLTHTTAC